MRKVYMNGEFVDEKEAKLSIYDSALMFGDMVFEMTRSFNKKQFKLKEHLERLYMGLRILQVPLKMTIDEMEQACYKTIEENEPFFDEHDEHRLLIEVSRGPLGIYSPVFDGETGPNVIIADFPLKWTVASMAPLFDHGINLVITSQRAIPGYLLDPKIKNRSRLFYQMANIEVSNVQGENNWALLLDPDGFITEGTGNNFFMVRNGEILTPEGRNILRGISRNYIFEVADQLGIPCKECNLEPYDLYEADESFITATPFCLLPCTSINGATIGKGQMGEITSALLKQWSANVEVDIEAQIKEFNKEIIHINKDAPTPYKFNKS
tara:strand:+ start:859 stop:1830 length:972 start_codon:yes stop_codon:yes gene_type:complete